MMLDREYKQVEGFSGAKKKHTCCVTGRVAEETQSWYNVRAVQGMRSMRTGVIEIRDVKNGADFPVIQPKVCLFEWENLFYSRPNFGIMMTHGVLTVNRTRRSGPPSAVFSKLMDVSKCAHELPSAPQMDKSSVHLVEELGASLNENREHGKPFKDVKVKEKNKCGRWTPESQTRVKADAGAMKRKALIKDGNFRNSKTR